LSNAHESDKKAAAAPAGGDGSAPSPTQGSGIAVVSNVSASDPDNSVVSTVIAKAAPLPPVAPAPPKPTARLISPLSPGAKTFPVPKPGGVSVPKPGAPPPPPIPAALAVKLGGKQIPELSGAVITGARRSDAPPPIVPRSRTPLPPLPPAPADGGPTTLPPPVDATAEDDVDIDLDAPVAPASEPPRAKGPPRGQLPAICMFGRFEILGRIAFGGMAEIFLGRETTQVGASRLLAIKRILPHVADDPKFVEMFLDEARLAIQLSHPNICHIYEFGGLEGAYFIAMEWIAGVPLGKIVRRARSMKGVPVEVGVRIIANVAEALHYAHTARDANGTPLQIVHRDCTPHNIMVSYDGRVKLLDFGIAKAESASTKTEAGVVKGKFAYMSPQQCLGKHIDGRADVFALGICMWEALTGKTLFQRDTDYETMKSVIEDKAPSMRSVRPDIPEALDAIVAKALEKSADLRYQNAAKFQEALEEWLASKGKAITTAKIAELMDKLFEEEIKRGPLVDSTPFGMSFNNRPKGGPAGTTGDFQAISGTSNPSAVAAGIASASQPSGVAAAVEPPKRNNAMIAAIGALALALVIAIGFIAFGGSAPPPTTNAIAAPPPTSVVVAPPTSVAPAPPTTTTPDVPAPVARGRVMVTVDVPTAAVRIGEQVLTVADASAGVELPVGHYAVHVEATGHVPFDGEIDVSEGEVARLDVVLPVRHVAPPAHLSINTRPWSKVYVGPRLLGTTPIGEASVPSGTVRLRIVDRDGRVFQRTVTIAGGASESVFYDLDH
jgi:serine/threonine-protein kinase